MSRGERGCRADVKLRGMRDMEAMVDPLRFGVP